MWGCDSQEAYDPHPGDWQYYPRYFPDAEGILCGAPAGPGGVCKLAHIRDGTSHTLMVGEVTARGHGTQEGRMWVGDNYCSTRDGINGATSTPGGGNVNPYDAGFASFHPGGCHFAMADGSVHFISENIAQVVLTIIATRPERVEMSGTVTYNGQPVSEATIRFVPEQGLMAPVSGAQVKDGAYKADQRGGVPVGTHKIEIKAYRKSEMSRPGTPDLLEASKEQQEQYIPAKYNRQSQLEIAIEPGSGKIIKNFDLTD